MLKPILRSRIFEKLEITQDCALRETIGIYSNTFKRGRAYYEFTHERENISEDKELIFMDKVNNEHNSGIISAFQLY